MTSSVHTYLKIRCKPFLWAVALALALAALLPTSVHAAATPVIATGTVTDTVTAQPIAGAGVSAARHNPVTGAWEWADWASTDASGAYTLLDWETLGAGEYRITAGAFGYISQTLTGNWDGVAPLALNFSLSPPKIIATGTVTDTVTAQPIAGAWVSAARYNPVTGAWEWAYWASTDASGAYTLLDWETLGAGEYRIRAGAYGYITQTQTGNWDGVAPLALNFSLSPPKIIATGTVTDTVTAQPIEWAEVWAERYDPATGDWEWEGRTSTDASGTYTLHDELTLGAGEWRVTAWAFDYITQTQTGSWDGVTPLALDFALIPSETDAPETTATLTPPAPDGTGGWYVTTPQITLSATDTISGVAWTEWRLGAGEWTRGTSVTGITDGTHTLSFRSADTAGNIEEAKTVTFKVDTAAPVTASDARASYTESATITLSATDTVSGVAVTRYQLNGAAPATYTAPVVINTTGAHTLSFWSVDAAGNTEAAKTATFTVAPAAVPPLSIPVEGPDRFETAVAASGEAFPDGLDPAGPRTVVIATGRNWPDALGGAALAGALGGPVLLVDSGSIPAAVSAEITRLGAARAVILGGAGAVGASVKDALKEALGRDNVTRIGGADRYATANLIAAEVRRVLGARWTGEVFVATGGNFPDALAAAPAAAAQGVPLYLAHPATGLSQATKDAMAGVASAIILGGTGVVSAGTETYLRGRPGMLSVTRLWGANRFETAVEVAQWTVNIQGHTWDRAGITTGLDFPDALAGGLLQGRMGSVMLLTPPDALDPHTRAALEANRAAIHTLTFFGGTGAVSEAVRAAALSAAE